MGDQPRTDRRKGPHIVLSFLLLLFCVLYGVIAKSVLKSIFSIISASGFRKKKKKTANKNKAHIWQYSSHENYYAVAIWPVTGQGVKH